MTRIGSDILDKQRKIKDCHGWQLRCLRGTIYVSRCSSGIIREIPAFAEAATRRQAWVKKSSLKDSCN